MKISNLFLLLAAPFSRIFGGRNVDQTSLPASNAATDDWLDLNKVSLVEESQGASWLGADFLKFPTIFPGAEAVMLAGKDFKTTVYCGPQTNCDYLRDAAKRGGVSLIEFDQGEKIKRKRGGVVDRLVIAAHGTSGARQVIDGNLFLQADDFMKKFFSKKLKVGHSVGCFVGADTENNFGQNSLESGQILFLHSDAHGTSLGREMAITKSLLLEPRQQFPLSSPFKILYAKPDPNNSELPLGTMIIESNPVLLEDLVEASKKEPKIDSIYDLIAKNINDQRATILESFDDDLGDRNIVADELTRLGFVDFTKETDPSKREKFVRDYLGQSMMGAAMKMGSLSQSEIGCIDQLLTDGLMDVNYALPRDFNVAYVAAEYGSSEYLDVLLRHGASTGTLDIGVNAAYTAAQSLQIESLKVMKKHGVDFNLRETASGAGFTPLFAVINRYKDSSPKDKAKCLEVIDILMQGGARADLSTLAGNAYQFAGQERALIERMRNNEKEGVRKPAASQVVVDKSRGSEL